MTETTAKKKKNYIKLNKKNIYFVAVVHRSNIYFLANFSVFIGLFPIGKTSNNE